MKSAPTSLWPYFEIGGLRVANRPGFGTRNLARMERARISLGILPLLERRLHVRAFSVEGLTLNLVRTAEGAVNWSMDRQGRTGEDPGLRREEAGERGNDLEAEFDLVAKAAQLASLNELLGVDLPPLQQCRVSARLLARPSQLELTGLDIRVKDSVLTGSALIDDTSAPPSLTAELISKTVQLRDFDTGDWSPEAAGPAQRKPGSESKRGTVGSGVVDFSDRTLDLTVTPKAKRPELFSLATPQRVRGDFDDFRVGMKGGPVALGTTALGFTVSPITVPLKRLLREDLPTDGADICDLPIGPHEGELEELPGC